MIFDDKGKAVAKGTEPLKTYYLDNGFVEQDPEEIFQNVWHQLKNVLMTFKSKGGDVTDINACGISNQRETFVVWDEEGKPLYNAVVWQCKRSVQICEQLKKDGSRRNN